MSEQPQELAEYHYWVGYVEMTAQLTPEMAKTYNAVPVGEPLPDPAITTNTELRGTVLTSAAAKMRAAKNKQA